MARKKQTGKVHVYTGDGKGKTTAAFGLAMRAAGKGLSVLIIQFMKGRSDCGEIIAAGHIPGIKVEQYGAKTLVREGRATDNDIRHAKKGLERARKAMASNEVDLLILDEVIVAAYFGLLTVDQIIELIDKKPASMELVLTGRRAKKDLIDRADYVTEMKAKKHPFDAGKKSRKGIEC